jgi:hypothetical protein
MADTLHDDSTLIRQPNSIFERADKYQRENGAAMFWTVFVELDGRAEPIGTAYELNSGEIILPAMPGGARILLKHDYRGAA